MYCKMGVDHCCIQLKWVWFSSGYLHKGFLKKKSLLDNQPEIHTCMYTQYLFLVQHFLVLVSLVKAERLGSHHPLRVLRSKHLLKVGHGLSLHHVTVLLCWLHFLLQFPPLLDGRWLGSGGRALHSDGQLVGQEGDTFNTASQSVNWDMISEPHCQDYQTTCKFTLSVPLQFTFWLRLTLFWSHTVLNY